jgi:hypothetical protein
VVRGRRATALLARAGQMIEIGAEPSVAPVRPFSRAKSRPSSPGSSAPAANVIADCPYLIRIIRVCVLTEIFRRCDSVNLALQLRRAV